MSQDDFRYLTPDEQRTLKERCPFCREEFFYLGPQGGLSWNVYCSQCLAGFNITHEKMPWMLICKPGERNFAELRSILSRAPVTMNWITNGITKGIEESLQKAANAVNGLTPPPPKPKPH